MPSSLTSITISPRTYIPLVAKAEAVTASRDVRITSDFDNRWSIKIWRDRAQSIHNCATLGQSCSRLGGVSTTVEGSTYPLHDALHRLRGGHSSNDKTDLWGCSEHDLYTIGNARMRAESVVRDEVDVATGTE